MAQAGRRGPPIRAAPGRHRLLRDRRRARHPARLQAAPRIPLGERREGDADAQLPAPARGPSQAAARRRPAAAGADDPPLRQRDRHRDPRHRRQRRAAAPRPGGAHARLPHQRRLGVDQDQRPGPGPADVPAEALHPAPPPPLCVPPALPRRLLPALGNAPGAAARLARLLQGRLHPRGGRLADPPGRPASPRPPSARTRCADGGQPIARVRRQDGAGRHCAAAAPLQPPHRRAQAI